MRFSASGLAVHEERADAAVERPLDERRRASREHVVLLRGFIKNSAGERVRAVLDEHSLQIRVHLTIVHDGCRAVGDADDVEFAALLFGIEERTLPGEDIDGT